jgi:outer membrane protein assembly factor BamB
MTITIAVFPLSPTNAHTPPIEVPTYAFLAITPDPIGVGQAATVVMWIDKAPVSATGIAGDRWTGYKITVTKPNGDTESLGPFTSDPTSSAYVQYTPDQTGTYTFDFSFPGQVASLYNPQNGLAGSQSIWIGDKFLGSNTTETLTVQQTPITLIPENPLPSEYWARPIEGQNTAWATIGSNWLGGEPAQTYNVQPDGTAPNSPHIMWTKPLQDGGVVGGTLPGVSYYQGDSYEMRFGTPMIINGRLYYPLPLGHAQNGGGYVSVDLQTGEQLWWQNWTSSLPGFGQIYDYETFNQHGVIPTGILWRTSGTTWDAYDSLTGSWLYKLTNVPSGTNVYGQTGEITRYVLNTQKHWLALWNNTQHNVGLEISIGNDANAYQWRPNGKTVDMSNATSWNVTIPNSVPPTSTVYYAIPEDLLLVATPTQNASEGGAFQSYGTLPYNVTAISLKPSSRGSILWSKQYDAPSGMITRFLGPVDATNRVFTTLDKETMQWSGYSVDNGNKLWGPVGEDLRGYTYYSSRSGAASSQDSIYEGKLYVGGFQGLINCYDTSNGNLLWTYGNGGEGNSTNSGLENVWGYYPTFLGGFADGKVYTFTQEHSVNMPIYKGATIRALNATTGQELWQLPGWAESTNFYSRIGAIADGYLTFFNAYDGQVYCIGKGPSAMTVDAPAAAITLGSSLVIRGTVTDIAAGTEQTEQAGRFPNGVPAVSDASQGAWMQYVYMQKPKPTNATGVTVAISVIDANGNYRTIGSATSDASGMFTYTWKPDIEGSYTVIATFTGSESYYPSSAETSFTVDPSAATPAPTQALTTSMADQYFLPMSIAIIVAIIVVGAVIVLAFRKRP